MTIRPLTGAAGADVTDIVPGSARLRPGPDGQAVPGRVNAPGPVDPSYRDQITVLVNHDRDRAVELRRDDRSAAPRGAQARFDVVRRLPGVARGSAGGARALRTGGLPADDRGDDQ